MKVLGLSILLLSCAASVAADDEYQWHRFSGTLDLSLRTAAPSILGLALFAWLGPTAPSIVSVTPSSGPGAALELAIEGSGFDATESVPEVYSAQGRLVATGAVGRRTTTRIEATVPLAGASPGRYTVKVRNPGGERSNEAVLTLRPEVAVSPRSGRPGTTFTYKGRGFTTGFGATSYLKRPNGLEFQARRIATSAEGTFDEVIWSGEFSPGTYTAWAVDDYTKTKAEPATFVIKEVPDTPVP